MRVKQKKSYDTPTLRLFPLLTEEILDLSEDEDENQGEWLCGVSELIGG